ncbi:AMP-binding enzyme family protein [Paraburkholderia xenovorans LB400]|uniref:AMP-dependent synthetase and ligase n=1 Tax=Paraburkholderia xenovorans (strain LB400) TaxID=266265 RepID=Q13GQ9_PARXL|nr:AMP-binding protein [Paraburkholderia xenovorans]ABE36730.1 Putative AMP-dependent synthetase and ligase [Paraburkholderia xenovorans LB400]AIP35068.1 AMP-binding enzyme family protein [Paraburkholderia xenovorans LB400]
MVSLSDSVAWWARTNPSRTALMYGNQSISYGDLQRRVEATAGMLKGTRIRRGDIVALLMKNSAAFVEIMLAVSQAGAVILPINYRLGPDEVAYILQHSGAKLLFHDEEFEVPPGLVHSQAVTGAAQSDTSVLAAGHEPCTEAYPSRPDDLYRLMYTSGTTDRPKGVMHSYGNVAWKSFDHIAALGITKDDRLLVVGPLYHVGACDLPGLAVLAQGGMLRIMRDFDAQAVLEAIERERLTGAWLAPVMLSRILALPERYRFDLGSLRWVVGGGERTPEQRIREFGSLFTGARYIDAYGLTESCSGDTLMEQGRELDKIGSTGRALAHVQLAIMSDDGRMLAPGMQGEICVRGPKVTQGYWKDPEKTARSFVDGWFRTGDVGYMDEEGFLYLTDRKKDMIISGGENIASSEVERVIYQLAEVAEAAVIGAPDPRWGEQVTAVVVLRAGATLTLDALRTHCEGRLGGFKTPRQLILRDALPRNPSGKVLKRVLRDELLKESDHDGQR